jgi:hypothetical protein
MIVFLLIDRTGTSYAGTRILQFKPILNNLGDLITILS